MRRLTEVALWGEEKKPRTGGSRGCRFAKFRAVLEEDDEDSEADFEEFQVDSGDSDWEVVEIKRPTVKRDTGNGGSDGVDRGAEGWRGPRFGPVQRHFVGYAQSLKYVCGDTSKWSFLPPSPNSEGTAATYHCCNYKYEYLFCMTSYQCQPCSALGFQIYGSTCYGLHWIPFW